MTTAPLAPIRSVTVPSLPAMSALSALSATTGGRLRAALLAIAGSILAIGLAALSLLVVPVAALMVFGPTLLSAL
jgi:hypothetical protein